MYEFSSGPLVWIAFLVFIGGSAYQLFNAIKLAKKDKVVYPYMNMKYGLRSLAHWVIPFGTTNMRMHPAFTVMSFMFHICLLLTPLFVLAHVLLFKEAWGVALPHIPDGLANALSIIVVVVGVIFFVRRLVNPTVRNVSDIKDFIIILLVISPFLTGILAYYQVFDPTTAAILHMWCGALWLIAIPFTRLIHMVFFPFTRAYMGGEFGYVRNSKDW